jgi:acetoin utilization deacetylase AcuC-like enzyme
VPPRDAEERWLSAVHDRGYITYLKRVCEGLDDTKAIYPYVFPIRNRAHPPVELAVRAGYYCIDTFTPLSRNAFLAARRAVDCAVTAAQEIVGGRRCAYALVRPPGHHAEREFFGGFCYFNNAAIAAEYLSRRGSVAMLDIDYHHGNGQQQIFYRRDDVLTVSLHGHPSFAYPYFSGFAAERGAGRGAGFNINYPLPETIEVENYLLVLDRALARIRRFAPAFVVVCLGLDTAQGDPTGTWPLRAADFGAIGERIGALGCPLLALQEGGYDNRTIGANARSFFTGLALK